MNGRPRGRRRPHPDAAGGGASLSHRRAPARPRRRRPGLRRFRQGAADGPSRPRARARRLVVRYNGGAQAGHNVVTPDGRHHTFVAVRGGHLRAGVRTFLSRPCRGPPHGSARRGGEPSRGKGVADAAGADRRERACAHRHALPPGAEPPPRAGARTRPATAVAGSAWGRPCGTRWSPGTTRSSPATCASRAVFAASSAGPESAWRQRRGPAWPLARRPSHAARSALSLSRRRRRRPVDLGATRGGRLRRDHLRRDPGRVDARGRDHRLRGRPGRAARRMTRASTRSPPGRAARTTTPLELIAESAPGTAVERIGVLRALRRAPRPRPPPHGDAGDLVRGPRP